MKVKTRVDRTLSPTNTLVRVLLYDQTLLFLIMMQYVYKFNANRIFYLHAFYHILFHLQGEIEYRSIMTHFSYKTMMSKRSRNENTFIYLL